MPLTESAIRYYLQERGRIGFGTYDPSQTVAPKMMTMRVKWIWMNGQMMTMKNEGLKINRGTGLQFPTISDIKNLLINEYDFGESLQNGRKIYLYRRKCRKNNTHK